MADGRWRVWVHVAAFAVAGLAIPGAVRAQATRTWVSGTGDDANPCSRTAPCKTFAGAITKTATGGEINALDPGGFGALTITKAITIDGGPGIAGVLASGTNGIVVNAGAADRVVLRNLDINGIGTGLDGIHVTAAGAVHVDHCEVYGFTGDGVEAAAAGSLFVNDTRIRGNTGAGVRLTPASGAVFAVLDGSHLESNGTGVQASDHVSLTVRNGTLAGSTGSAGLVADGATTGVNVEHVAAVGNATGFLATNGAVIRTLGVVVAGNSSTGFEETAGGKILAFDGNLVASNGTGAVGATCDATAESIACPSDTCPAPVCPTPTVSGTVGPCKRCKTRGGVTTCAHCAVALE